MRNLRKHLLWIATPFLVALLVAVGWLAYLSRLQRAFPSGCLDAPVETLQPTNVNRRFQEVLNRASHALDDTALQATVIIPQGQTWTGASGFANRQRRCSAGPDSYFYIGSATKMYTAALLLSLVDEGKLSLDDPISLWLPGAIAEHDITVRQLLNHTSGIPSYTENTGFLLRYFLQPRRVWQPQELLAFTDGQALKFLPGSKHEYSNSNYLALGLIIEKVGGDSYGTLLRERILHPLDLHETYFLEPEANDLPVAHGYEDSLPALGRIDLTALRTSLITGAYSAGAIVATSEDLANFTQALFEGRVLSEQSLAEMTAFLDVGDEDLPQQTGYGLGLRRLVIDGHELWGHTGIIPGYSAISMYSPQQRHVITLMMNRSMVINPAVGDRIPVLADLQRLLPE